MTDTKEISWDDSVLPFHLEGPDMRGRIARLGQTLEHILSRHDYPVAVSALVAELSRRHLELPQVFMVVAVPGVVAALALLVKNYFAGGAPRGPVARAGGH